MDESERHGGVVGKLRHAIFQALQDGGSAEMLTHGPLNNNPMGSRKTNSALSCYAGCGQKRNRITMYARKMTKNDKGVMIWLSQSHASSQMDRLAWPRVYQIRLSSPHPGPRALQKQSMQLQTPCLHDLQEGLELFE